MITLSSSIKYASLPLARCCCSRCNFNERPHKQVITSGHARPYHRAMQTRHAATQPRHAKPRSGVCVCSLFTVHVSKTMADCSSRTHTLMHLTLVGFLPNVEYSDMSMLLDSMKPSLSKQENQARSVCSAIPSFQNSDLYVNSLRLLPASISRPCPSPERN